MLRQIFRKRRNGVPGVAFFACLCVVSAPSLMAQMAGLGALTGRVIDASGNAVANVTVTATGNDNSEVRSATSGTDGSYRFEGLQQGNYRLKFEATGLKTSEIPSTTVDGTEMTVPDEKLEAGQSVSSTPAPTRQDDLPNAPSSSKTEPSLADLGLSPEQTQGNAREQALLDKRTHMLKIHQRMGLITTGPLIATVIASVGGGGQEHQHCLARSSCGPWQLTADLYGITAYYAIRAPEFPERKSAVR